jgi:gliding motility-associated-like protein
VMRSPIILLFLIVLPLLADAQYLSNNGRFQVAEIKGCSPFNVIITSTTLSPFQTTWGDGASGPNETTHTYTITGTTPQTFRISVQFPSPLGSDFIDIVVTPNVLPAFDIYTCNGQQVQVKVNDTNYDSYIVDFGDMSATATVIGAGVTSPHLYASPISYTVNVRGKNFNAADNCTPAPKTVTAVNALTPPIIDLVTVSGDNQLDINFTGNSNVRYRTQYAANSSVSGFSTVAGLINDVSTTTVSNSTINTINNFYCMRIGATDPCNTSTAPVYSSVVCSIEFTAEPLNNLNRLTWETDFNNITFSLLRNGTPIASPTSALYDDPSRCKTDSCYQLIATNTLTGSQSISAERCVTAITNNTPTSINDVTAVVGISGVDLSWTQDPLFQAIKYSISRRAGSGGYNPVSTTTTTTFTDATYRTGEHYCYQINYVDACDVQSASGLDVCPIELTGKVNSDRTITLDWSNYTGWVTGILRYEVEKYDEEGTLVNTFNRGSSTTFDDIPDADNQLYRYIVLAYPIPPGVSQAVSNEEMIALDPVAIFPKAFTPNNDNLNDEYKVIVPENFKYVDGFEMKIFNRWGELIFTSNDQEKGWDGKYKGTNQPEGMYIFSATLTDLTGRTFKRSGSLVLLRKK